MFYKYHGCGNDFIIAEYADGIDYGKLTQKICNRYVGVGADTFIVIKKGEFYGVDFYNADGTLAPMCGNGIRCAAQFLKDMKYVEGNEINIETMTGLRKVYYNDNGIMINMGSVSYDKNLLDLDYDGDQIFDYNYLYKGIEYNLNAIFLTTHHLVIPVEDLNISDEVADYFCKNKMFKKMINVDFVKIVDRKNILVKTYERGVGWTKACGSGTTSSVAVLNKKGLVDDEVKAEFEYGYLIISRKGDDYYMTGPAKLVASDIKFYE